MQPHSEPLSSIFQFEADFANTLRCIPMAVRFKLDICGVKLKLDQWHAFTQHERQALLELPCGTEAEISNYRWLLQRLVLDHTGESAKDIPVDPHPAWATVDAVPDETQTKASEFGLTIQVEQWATLTPLQRFVLTKLSRPSHESRNFLPAMQEFGLDSPA